MAGNLLILAHFGEEFAHFGKNLYILGWRDNPARNIFNIFLANPAPERNKYFRAWILTTTNIAKAA